MKAESTSSYPPVYYELVAIPGVKINRNFGSMYESICFTFKELGKEYRLYLLIRKIGFIYHLSWKVVFGAEGNVIRISSLEDVLERSNEEAQSFLLFHLDIFKDQTNKPY